MNEKDIRGALENKTIIADGTMDDEVNYIFNQMQEQKRLVQTRITIEDIIKAYKGEIDWNTYLKERHEYNAKVQEENNRKIVNFRQSKEEYKIEYKIELPILDFTTFAIAEALGKRDRNEEAKGYQN